MSSLRYACRWVEISWESHALYDLLTQQRLRKIWSGQFRGLDVSQAGDLFSVDAWDHYAGLYRLAAGQDPPPGIPGEAAFLCYGEPALDSMMSVLGITTAGNQLLISDRYAVYFWNDYHSVTQGRRLHVRRTACGGSPTLAGGGNSYLVKSDSSGRVWINDAWGNLRIFEGPLTASSTPTKAVSVNKYKGSDGSITWLPSGVTLPLYKFQPIGSGDRAWAVDEEHSRVVRVVNINGVEAPTEPPYIDVVIGQPSLTATQCNQGRGELGFGRAAFCREGMPMLDAQGNFFLEENATGWMDGGLTRILRWDSGTIPDDPAATLFNVLPDSVYGAGRPTNFTVAPTYGNQFFPCYPNETACPARAPAFAGERIMALGGANPYGGARFPMVYLDKDENFAPQLALGDVMSFPSVSYFDPDGNLYLGDFDWSRVLVYKAPLARFSACGNGVLDPGEQCDDGNLVSGDGCDANCQLEGTPTPTRTPIPTPTRTPTPTQSSTTQCPAPQTYSANESIAGYLVCSQVCTPATGTW